MRATSVSGCVKRITLSVGRSVRPSVSSSRAFDFFENGEAVEESNLEETALEKSN